MNFLDRLMGRQPARKATTGGPWLAAYQQGPSLSNWGVDWQERAGLYLAAYKVDWFYKAGARISRDFAQLAWSLAYEDVEGDNEEAIVAPANDVPFDELEPLEQFLRLSERPNPFQSGRTLKQRQMIRYLFTGRAIYYLEGAPALPTALYGISPSRMWPSRNARGELIGWVLDKNSPSGGVPFDASEILVVEDPGTEDDAPQGVVEAVYAQARLSPMIPQHIADVLSTGGRLAGMAWPKERSLSEDEFADAQRAWRNVASDPNAARRLLLFPEPMEYEAGAATPKEIGVPELADLSRDDILTAFPISPYMLGVPMPGGLNSAETRKEERHDYWEGSIHPRVEAFEDAFQQGLLPLYEAAVGRPLDFDIEEPDLDDAPALIEKVGAYRGLVSVGFDAKESVRAVGLDHIKWNGLPDLLDPAKQAEMAAQAATTGGKPAQGDGARVVARDTTTRDSAAAQQTIVGKAITRDDVLGEQFPGLQAALTEFLDEQRERVMRKVAEVMPTTKAERIKAVPPGWWDSDEEDRLLRERLREIYLAIGRNALQVTADNSDRVLSGKQVDRVLEDQLARAGLRISDINETTRRSIAEVLDIGTKRGYSIPQLVNGVPAEAYGGVQGALLANGVQVWDAYRAEVIARTETMNAYNTSALLGYKELAVRQVQAIDGDADAECSDRDGRTYSVDDALSVADHPNGTLDWVPLT